MSTRERLIVKESPGKGRGVFAGQDFEEGDVIEVCPVIVVPADQYRHIELTVLGHYVFNWRGSAPFPVDRRAVAVVLGRGGLHNHSPDPNAAWENDLEENVMRFFAVRPIAAGEEIMINYGRRAYRRGSVDPPPWWSGPFRRRPGKGPRAVIVAIVAAALAGMSIVRVRRRRARRSSAVKG